MFILLKGRGYRHNLYKCEHFDVTMIPCRLQMSSLYDHTPDGTFIIIVVQAWLWGL